MEKKATDQKKENFMNHVCLCINPDIYIDNTSKWMEVLGVQHPERQLKDIFIPGTHDSGTYGIKDTRYLSGYLIPPSYANPELEEANKPQIMKLAPDVARALAKAQEKRVFEQLKDGIRFLDIRPCIKGKNDFWISHSIYSVPLDEVLNDISEFLKENKQELIIIDFRFVFGLSSDRERLSEVLWNKVNEKLKKNLIYVETPKKMASLTLSDISRPDQEEGKVILLWDIHRGKPYGMSENFVTKMKCGLNTREWADIVGEGDEYDSVDKLRKRIYKTILKRNKDKMCLVKCEPDEPVGFWSVTGNLISTSIPFINTGLRSKASNYNPAMMSEIKNSWNLKLEGGYIYTFDYYNIPKHLAKTIIERNYA